MNVIIFKLPAKRWKQNNQYFVQGTKMLITLTMKFRAGHVIRQDDDDLSRRVLLSEPGGKRPRGRPGCVGNMEWRKM